MSTHDPLCSLGQPCRFNKFHDEDFIIRSETAVYCIHCGMECNCVHVHRVREHERWRTLNDAEAIVLALVTPEPRWDDAALDQGWTQGISEAISAIDTLRGKHG